MKQLLSTKVFIVLLSTIILFINKEVIFNGKILFPSNFLVSFYSPFSTEKIKGWEQGVTHKPIGDDQIRIFYPERSFTNSMLSKGVFPLWDPYIFSGTPHIADFQSSVFYPLNFLYLIFPQINVWTFLLIIQPFLAAIFMYLFLKLFPIQKAAVWLGAISFGFSGFIIVWSQENMVVGQAALWLPLALFGIEGFLKTRKLQYYLTAVLALAFSFLAGFFQVTFYIFVLTFLYGLFRLKNMNIKHKFKSLFSILSIYLFSLCLVSIQLFPSFEGFLNSPRSSSSAWYLFKAYLLPVTHVFNVFIPDIFGNPGSYNFFGRGFYRETIIYIGLVPTIFTLYAFAKAKKNFVIKFFIAALILSSFFTLNSPFTKWFFNLPLPLLPTFLPSRILLITAFSLSVLSAFGFSGWIEQKEKQSEKFMTILIFSAFFIFVSIGFYALIMLLNFKNIDYFKTFNSYFVREFSVLKKSDITIILKNLIIPSLMLSSLFVLINPAPFFRPSTLVKRLKILNPVIKQEFLKKCWIKLKKRNLAVGGIILLALLGQIYFFNKYKILGEPQFLYPQNSAVSFLQSKKSLDRFISLGQPFQENISIYKHLYSIEGVNPIFPNKYGQLLFAAVTNGKITKDIPRVEARLSEMGENEKIVNDTRRLRLLSLLNTKYVLYFDNRNSLADVSSKYPIELFNPVWQENNWYAFEYKKALPRAFLANAYVEKDPQKILNLIFDTKFDLLRNVILEEKPSEQTQVISGEQPGKNSVLIKNYQPSEIEILVKTNKPKMLFLSENYYPGWKAYVDGHQTKIYRANYTFRGISVPSGEHQVRLLYDPQSFRIGFYISLFSVILFFSIILRKIITILF